MRRKRGDRGHVQEVRGARRGGVGMPLRIGGVVILAIFLIGFWLTGAYLVDRVGAGDATGAVV